MATNAKIDREAVERGRLMELFSAVPENKKAALDGIIHEAARLRVLCDDLWQDIQENGKFETWVKAGEEYERERDAFKAYRDADRLYQSIMKELDSKLPAKESKSGFAKLDDDD